MEQSEVRKLCAHPAWFICTEDFIENVFHKREWVYIACQQQIEYLLYIFKNVTSDEFDYSKNHIKKV